MKLLTSKECKSICGGAAPLLTSVVAIGAIAIIVITAYKLYQSLKGEVNLGAGIKFKWEINGG